MGYIRRANICHAHYEEKSTNVCVFIRSGFLKKIVTSQGQAFLYVCVRACVCACACTCVSVHYDGIESEHGDGSPEGEDRPELAILKYNTSLSNSYL